VDTDRLAALETLGYELLELLGENPGRPGLQQTPARWARWWLEFIEHEPGQLEASFEHVTSDDLVVVGGMGIWSLCEHHLLPWEATVAIGYLPEGQVLGLSKFARIAHQVAHRLQVQERLVAEIADQVEKLTGVPDVAVVACGRHLCMSMRGVRTAAQVTTSVMRGRFHTQPELRAEFLTLAAQAGGLTKGA
jgi:GTP cyclohydrolase IA